MTPPRRTRRVAGRPRPRPDQRLDPVDELLQVMTRAWGVSGRWEAARRFAALRDDVNQRLRGDLKTVNPREIAETLVQLGYDAATFADELEPARRRRSTSSRPSAPPGSPNPYSDPSRDVGEGPDTMTRMQSIIVTATVLFGIYLGAASCGTATPEPVEHRCHLCNELGYP